MNLSTSKLDGFDASIARVALARSDSMRTAGRGDEPLASTVETEKPGFLSFGAVFDLLVAAAAAVPGRGGAGGGAAATVFFMAGEENNKKIPFCFFEFGAPSRDGGRDFL